MQRWFNVASTQETDIVSILCNVEKLTLEISFIFNVEQRNLDGDPQCWNNVDPTLKYWQDSIIYEKVNS